MSTVNTTNVKNAASSINNIVLGSTGDTQVQSLNTGALAGLRNQIINGSTIFWQRGNTGAGVGTYVCDRWALGGVSPTVTRKTVSTADAQSGVPATYAIGLSSTTGGASSLRQYIELLNIGRCGPYPVGSKWTYSFYANTQTVGDVSANTISWYSSGTGANVTAGTVGDVVKLEDVGSTWARYSFVVTITVACPGSADAISCGVGNGAQGSTVVNFTGMQFEPGPVVTPFELRPIGLELNLCQRYYQDASARGLITSVAATAGVASAWIPGITMRTTPSTNVGTIRFIKWWGSSVNSPSISSVSLGQGGITLSFAAITTDTSQDFRIISGFDGNTSKDLALDAEF